MSIIRAGDDGNLRGRGKEMLDKHFDVNKSIRRSGTTEELLEAIEIVQNHKEKE